MTTVQINLSDEQAASLEATAAVKGLTLVAYLQRIVEEDTRSDEFQRSRAAAARIREIQQRSKPDPEGRTVHDYINHGRP